MNISPLGYPHNPQKNYAASLESAHWISNQNYVRQRTALGSRPWMVDRGTLHVTSFPKMEISNIREPSHQLDSFTKPIINRSERLQTFFTFCLKLNISQIIRYLCSFLQNGPQARKVSTTYEIVCKELTCKSPPSRSTEETYRKVATENGVTVDVEKLHGYSLGWLGPRTAKSIIMYIHGKLHELDTHQC